MSTNKITFCLNWQAAPYHAPIYLAQKLGYFKDEGLDIAILEPGNPSDVTELIGSGKVDMGLKAMIHTLAAKARGFPVTSVGSLLDEPFTGILYLESSGITDFQSLKGKRIGYVGEFGKIQLDELTKHYGMTPDDYTAVRSGMNVAREIINGNIDAGIGIECVQQVELEEYLRSQGKDVDGAKMLRIDKLAELGCCCFCTVLYIVNDKFLAANPDKVRKFMSAVKRATDYVIQKPAEAYADFIEIKPLMGTPLNYKIFQRSYAYFSESLYNVHRDWNKVNAYGKRLMVLPEDFKANYTNEYLSWPEPKEVSDPLEAQRRMNIHQEQCKCNPSFKRLALTGL
ncbi:Hydroxymethylpyrimidine phosphate synthase involved in thiamine biosynthesis [Komagataella phaffii CBS 7435]|uniref:4-amino-5-hydroxymethyl-2-methylpyrimidine phosphate synthase n=2 Tax=Komagataella phaffii TaxID=460519 RepID=C4R6R6_KOMPG|nr:Protein involved in synthesis of the thiamine precursor hydroxymethylpyrimidine (HMP) [Komagataella phaffii GS115]AOA65181.1 GQ67_04371T0 [Komagataella phaffii]CAH2451366.1 Hydroxymethylpyrimidine phosphate synthase involved in thiamine biosynthesis [Komagataella phaffii CBS 7435]AOA69717.1 GQ68_04343T0 [Komagataella phaffii GS115]CAY71291.1 Protein involved in synthesis of the thiamine precursor hydroxymethylpyrimidine (HMP) [Komagataella phaffii GS115]CCA41102.1 Hydroxymethylpyrimidine ph